MAASHTPEQLIARNLKLVPYVVNQHRRTYLPEEDLMQVGRLALWRAACGFDPAQGHRFSTYAVTAIRRAVEREATRPALWAERECSLDSLRLGVRDEDGEALVDLLPDPAAEDPEAALLAPYQHAELREALAQLPPRYARVLALRYGLEGGEPRTCAEVAEILGDCGRGNVNSLEHRGLKRLREILAGSRLAKLATPAASPSSAGKPSVGNRQIPTETRMSNPNTFTLDHQQFGARLQQARKTAGFTSREALARQVGVSPKSLLLAEQGQSIPRAETLVQLCRTLGVTSDWLLGLSER